MLNAVYFKDGRTEEIVAYNMKNKDHIEFYTRKGIYVYREYIRTVPGSVIRRVQSTFYRNMVANDKGEFLQLAPDVAKIELLNNTYLERTTNRP